jgi:hypothetical protein
MKLDISRQSNTENEAVVGDNRRRENDNLARRRENDNLARLDSAILLQLNQIKSKYLTFQEFYALYEKVGAYSMTSTLMDDDLTQPERALSHLLSQASSTYTIAQVHGKILHRMDDSSLYWCLERMPGNRRIQLAMTTSTTTAPTLHAADSDKIRLAIMQQRADTATKQKEETGARPKRALLLTDNPEIDALIQPGMTIDERVQARATAKHHKIGESNHMDTADADNNGYDKEWLLHVADALWQYSNAVIARHERQQQTITSNTLLALTLKSTVLFLSRTLKCCNSSKSVGGATSRGDKTSRRQIVATISELCQLTPEWIRVDAAKDDTIWLTPTAYKQARTNLSGRSFFQKKVPMNLKLPPASEKVPFLSGYRQLAGIEWLVEPVVAVDSNQVAPRQSKKPRK